MVAKERRKANGLVLFVVKKLVTRSKNFDERPHSRGMFHWENLIRHSIAYADAAGKLEPWLTVCRENQVPLGTVLIGVRENPAFIPLKSAIFCASLYRPPPNT